jgi:Mn-containing catalase
MYYHDPRLQFPVEVTEPDPAFARALQQAIGGVEGEIRVCMQYFFQAWNTRAPNNRYRDLLLHTATEEISHIEMLATAVALNLEKAPAHLQEEGVADKLVGAVMGGERPRQAIEGMIHKQMLSAGMGAMPIDSDGVPFNMSNVYASGNIAADMTANVAAESTGRVLAVRLYNMAHDEGMKKMLAFLIARDTMHQNQWLAVIEDLGGFGSQFPIPNSFPQAMENQEFNYSFFVTSTDGKYPEGRWSHGPSMDTKGEFTPHKVEPMGDEPVLGPARPDSGNQTEQMSAGSAAKML